MLNNEIKNPNKKKITIEHIIFFPLFLICFFTFIFAEIGDHLRGPFSNLLMIFSFKCISLLGIMGNEHVIGVKRLLFEILFPLLVFKALADSTLKDLIDSIHLVGLGVGHALFEFIFSGCILWLLNKMKILTKPEFLASVVEMGSVAAGATGFPFADEIGRDSQFEMTLMFFGGKIWALGILCIIVNFMFAEDNFSIGDLCLKICKMPIIQAFLIGLIFLIAGWKTKNLKITGFWLTKVNTLTNPIIMIFIGLKITVPNLTKLHYFVPIFLHRGMTFVFLLIIQGVCDFNQDTFTTLAVYCSAAFSVWPYYHLVSTMPDPKDNRADKNFLLQIIAYDYSLAVFVNMVVSSISMNLIKSLYCTIGCFTLLIICVFFKWIKRNSIA